MDALAESARNLATYKDALDLRLASFRDLTRAEQRLLNISGIDGGETHPGRSSISITPTRFVMHAVPSFAAPLDFEYVKTREYVDPSVIVSGRVHTFGGLAKFVSHRQLADDLMDRLDDDRGSDPAHTIKYGRLPLYAAGEGKNRVALYRRFGRPMRTTVIVQHFPEPEKLMLHRIRPFGIWAISKAVEYEMEVFTPSTDHDIRTFSNGERRIVQHLPFSDVALPLFRAYGVPDGEAFWDLNAFARWKRARRLATNDLLYDN